MAQIGIMQGRLLPPQSGYFQCFPREHWADEFPRAAEAELDTIEWIYDLQGVGCNPIETDDGIAKILTLSDQHGISVTSLCADYYMDRPFVTARPYEETELVQHFVWLLGRCRKLGITRIVLPFVDTSRIERSEQEARVVGILTRVLPVLEEHKVELHLETSLAPDAFSFFLRNFETNWIKANYDSGNSSSLGYDPAEEIARYGERIGSVHIKDRVRGGGTVPLGQGGTDFNALFSALRSVRYDGDYVLQVARGDPGNEVDWARKNRLFVLQYLNQDVASKSTGARS